MKQNNTTEREQLEQAIAHLEGQRSTLGDSVVDAALAPLQAKLQKLSGEVQAAAGSGERRILTILFCDVAGSTALAEGMDPEAWTRLMNTAFEQLVEPVRRYGGTVARLMGDAILAFFGAPIAHEDDPQRAVLAGLAILENVRPLREKLGKERGLNFNVRVGINTGLALVGEVGSGDAVEYTAMGDAVNVAARMEQTAHPGTVRIAQETYALVAPIFECESLGGVSVKGKSQPVPAYSVLRRKSEPGSLRGLTSHGISSPLVGRETALQAARKAFTRLLGGEGGILAIIGDAGVGKSRLLEELRSHPHHPTPAGEDGGPQTTAGNRAITWLEGPSLSYGRTISYWPFQRIVRGYAKISEEDDETQAWSKLETSILDLFAGEAVEILPYLASLLSLEPRESFLERVKYLDGEALRRQVYRATRRFTRRLADRKPLVLVFDDLHWMDITSAGLLEHLLPVTQLAPLLICVLSRPDDGSPFIHLRETALEEYGNGFTEINLEPLSAAESNQLVRNLLEIDGLPAHLRRMMVRKADGNPFYLEEMVRNLIETGALVHEPATGRWQATSAAENVSVPDSLQGLLAARIDRLDDDLKRVLRRAAVIGRSFLYRLLAAIMADNHDLEQQLDRLQQFDLIREKQRKPELEYAFKHSLAQQAAYEGILLQERRQLHAQVGTAIETLMADRLEEFYGVLAYHYSAAEQWDRAQEYLLKAADQAGRVAADAEALALYRQSMEAYAHVRGDEWDPIERARLERKIGEALFRLGEHDQARTYLDRSLALLGERLPVSRWGTRLAILSAAFTQAGHRLFPRLFIRPEDGGSDSLSEDVFLAYQALGWVELATDVERYLLIAIQALNASEQSDFAYGSAHLASSVAPALFLFGFTGLAERYYRHAADYAKQVEPYRPVFLVEAGLAFKFNLLGEIDKSLEHALRGAEIAQSSGALREWGSSMLAACWAYYFKGELDKAADSAQEMINVGEEGADRQVVVWGLTGLGTSQRRLGRLDEAIANLLRARELASELPDYNGLITSGAWLARCYLAKGEWEQALSVLATISTDRGASSNIPYLANALSEAYLTGAERSTDEARQAWIKKARHSIWRALQAAKRNRTALPDALLFRGRYEWLRGKSESAQKWWQQALAEARGMGERYMEGMVHQEIGRRLGDDEHLQRAVSILEALGAEFDLKEAREAIQISPER